MLKINSMKRILLIAGILSTAFLAEAQTSKQAPLTDSLKRKEAKEMRRERVKEQIKELNLSKRVQRTDLLNLLISNRKTMKVKKHN